MSVKVTGLTSRHIEVLQRFYPTASNGRQMMQLQKTTAKFWGDKTTVLNHLKIALEQATHHDENQSRLLDRVLHKVETA